MPPKINTNTYLLNPRWFVTDWLHLWPLCFISKLRSTSKVCLNLNKSEQSMHVGNILHNNLISLSSIQNKHPSVLQVLKKQFLKDYLLIGIWKILWIIFTWLGAYYILQLSLEFLLDKYTLGFGYLFSVMLLLTSLFSSISIHQLYQKCMIISVRVKGSLSVMIYRKSLKVFSLAGGAGQVINLLTTDVQRISDSVNTMHFLWACFVEAVLIIIISFVVIGYPAFLALAIVAILMPIQIFLGKKTSHLQHLNTLTTTKRVHLMSEILTAIKLIKFYAWEKPFSSKIKQIRNEEMKFIQGTLILKAINFAIVFAVPVIVALLCLSTYKYTIGKPSPVITFTILSVFNSLRYPFLMLPLAVKNYAAAKLSLKRIDEFMALDEVDEFSTLPLNEDPDYAICLKGCAYSWESSTNNSPFLNNITLQIKKNELVAVIGDVGSGKSSLLAAIMGQMNQLAGEKCKLYGKLSYVPQEAWMLNMILKDNIIFGKDFDEELYKTSIKVSCLERDLTLLAAGDNTEIAERGSNLSGGQRQRLSMARAVYSNGDIVLLDDPLSAVDQNVGRQMFENCIKTQFQNKAVVFVTHQLQYLPQVDRIICMKDGQINKIGSYDQLMQDIEFATLINTHVVSDQDVEGDEISVNENSNAQLSNSLEQLTFQEKQQLSVLSNNKINEKTISSMIERNQLNVVQNNQKSHNIAEAIQRNQLSVYSQVVPHSKDIEIDEKSMLKDGKLTSEDKSASSSGTDDLVAYLKQGTGMFYSILVCVLFFLVHGIRIASDFWLRLWVPNTLNTSDDVYLGTYAAFAIAFGLGVLVRGLIFAYETSKKAHILHDTMFRSILRAPMSFFDTTPVGRILAAFSKHQFHIDDTMPDVIMQALQYAPLALAALVLIASVVHWPNAVTIVGIVILSVLFIIYTSRAETELKRLDSITKPGVYAHLATTVEGLFSIRAYNVQTRFDLINTQLLDANQSSYYALQSVKTFIAFYLDVFSSFIVFFTALYIVIYRDSNTRTIVTANAGLALSNALQMLVFLQWTVKAFGDSQSQMSSVGQVAYYGTQIEEEAPTEVPENKPKGEWPSDGEIKFENLSLKYHKFGVKVLKSVNLHIKAKEKIGIVGRTGSGKSTLLISLLRIVESCEGRIFIDDVDISKIGLDDLRTSVAIIPQEPVLFVGTIRYNLDPFAKCTDDEIWNALSSVHLKDKIQKSQHQLETMVIENGKNFSLGQRQLFCIARAILSKAKILVLDEATAAIDMATDLLIQTAIKENFADITVLTIAHRLNTIIEADKVLVMDGGVALEFKEPYKLLQDANSSFSDLVNQTGASTSKKLMETARLASIQRKHRNGGTSPLIEKLDPLTHVFQNPKNE